MRFAKSAKTRQLLEGPQLIHPPLGEKTFPSKLAGYSFAPLGAVPIAHAVAGRSQRKTRSTFTEAPWGPV